MEEEEEVGIGSVHSTMLVVAAIDAPRTASSESASKGGGSGGAVAVETKFGRQNPVHECLRINILGVVPRLLGSCR